MNVKNNIKKLIQILNISTIIIIFEMIQPNTRYLKLKNEQRPSNSYKIFLENLIQNQICDLKQYSKLLMFDCDEFDDIKQIVNCPDTLEELYCMGNMISNLDSLGENIIKIVCKKNLISKLNNLPFGLKYLDCSYNKISNLDMMPEGLEILICSYNKLIKLEDLPNGLKKLHCENNLIENIDNLPKSLVELICNNNKISKLQSLPSELYLLSCSKNNLTNIIKLDELNLLEEADLSYNNISGIGMDLSNCQSLKILNCSSNEITSLPKLPHNLEELYIHSNPLKQITFLPQGLEIISIDDDVNDDVNDNANANILKKKLRKKLLILS
jgi:Leucine-rich repeat (LRR) protein